MDLKTLVPQRIRQTVTATTVVMTVLIASVVVAGVLAWQAIAAAEQRQAVSEAMLRQYAQLAAWEFSREARKDIETALMHTLHARVHPDRHTNADSCDCAAIDEVDLWFEIGADGKIATRSGQITPAVQQALARLAPTERRGSMEGNVRILPLGDEDVRIVAVRWEPHVGDDGALIGLIASPRHLEPILAKTHRRTALLPPLLVGNRDARALVDLRVHDRTRNTVFASRDTVPGPHSVDADLLPNVAAGMRVVASMTPAFVAGLGPEHGAGPSQLLVVSLVVVNGLLVTIAVWQLARERELSRLRADFVAGVSHELRTPLAQIRMFAETLLLDRIRNPYEGRRALEIIGQETRRLSQLVENVLYFHRHQRVPIAAPTEVVDLVPFIREVVDGFSPLAGSRRVQVEYQPAVTELSVHASADGLRQVLLNLLDNAVKFGPPGQIVRVQLDVVNDTARIAVEDHGPGVPPDERRRIFNAFERGRKTHGAGGAGIGLSVVRQIVGAHHGHVAVESAPEGGARFVITLVAA